MYSALLDINWHELIQGLSNRDYYPFSGISPKMSHPLMPGQDLDLDTMETLYAYSLCAVTTYMTYSI